MVSSDSFTSNSCWCGCWSSASCHNWDSATGRWQEAVEEQAPQYRMPLMSFPFFLGVLQWILL